MPTETALDRQVDTSFQAALYLPSASRLWRLSIMMVEMEVHRVQLSSKAYHRVVLRQKEGVSCLHIVIGPSEARAISLAHNGQRPKRPLSYDLACALLEEVDARLQRVEITDLQEGIYYAQVLLESSEGATWTVDSRPSDAIALALRANAPIFVAEAILEEEEPDDIVVETDSSVPTPSELLGTAGDAEPLGDIDLLKRRLGQAASEEAYEEAARLRDRISQLQNEADG
jgi:bifunctional DNase/RNase